MTSSSLGNILALEKYKAVIDEDSSSNNPYLEAGNLCITKECLSRSKWFKGSNDRGFRGTLAEEKK